MSIVRFFCRYVLKSESREILAKRERIIMIIIVYFLIYHVSLFERENTTRRKLFVFGK